MSKITKLFFVLLTLNFLLLASRFPLFAQDTTDPNADYLRDATKEKVRDQIQEDSALSLDNPKRAFAGEIIKITDNQVTLDTPRLGELQIIIPATVIIIGQNKAKTTFDKLQIGDYILAMGLLSSTTQLEGKRILVIDKPEPENRSIIFGKISDISKEEKVLTLKNEKRNEVYSLEIVSTSKMTKKAADKVTNIDITGLKTGDQVLVITTPSVNNPKMLSVQMLRVISAASQAQNDSALQNTPTP